MCYKWFVCDDDDFMGLGEIDPIPFFDYEELDEYHWSEMSYRKYKRKSNLWNDFEPTEWEEFINEN